ncbi:MAG: hypothetical protein K6E74_04300 [Bacilli bacterium]|nr:hypothetical protein [Bacilli bacterium]
MKKLTTKLLMSIIAVAFAFVALGTSTYAWFTMSTSVSATGMQVTAKSNATYLLIDNVDNASTKTTSDITKAAAYATVGNEEKKVYPAAYTTTAIGSTISANSWYTASNGNPHSANDDVKNYQTVQEGAANYMLTYKVWLTLSEDSEDAPTQYKIKVTFSLASGDAAVSAYVKFAGNEFNLNSENNEATTDAAVALAHNASVEVTVYVYVDGNSTNVNTDYITAPSSQTITGNASLSFDLVDANA